ncbi:MAG: hypothetical protein JWL73_1024 [Actinomycetia bacterium]|nr:hypothetical protein [Actinomycetes bacterium]
MEESEEELLPKITAASLRDPAQQCGRRLALELGNRKRATWGDNVRWRLSDRINADIRLAHTELRSADPTWFHPPTDLLPEQQMLYTVTTRAYCALFADRPAVARDPIEWSVDVPELGVRLVGPPPLILDDEHGALEVRLLRVHQRPLGPDLAETVEVRFLVARIRAALHEDRDGPEVRVCIADLVDATYDEITVDPYDSDVDAWLEAGVAAVKLAADETRVRQGHECARCAYVPGCKAHK